MKRDNSYDNSCQIIYIYIGHFARRNNHNRFYFKFLMSFKLQVYVLQTCWIRQLLCAWDTNEQTDFLLRFVVQV